MAARRSRRQRMRQAARTLKKGQRRRQRRRTGASRTIQGNVGLLGQERARAKTRRARRRQFRQATRQKNRTARQAARQSGRTARTMARQARKAAKNGGIDPMAAMGAGMEMMDEFDDVGFENGGFENGGGGGVMDSPFFWPVIGAAGIYLLFFRKKK